MSGHYAEDISGRTYGYYTVIGRAPNQERISKNGLIAKTAMWHCFCQICGHIKIVRGAHLKSGKIKSNGCYRNERVRETLVKHGGTRTKLYYVWCDMKNRCNNKNVPCYERYGGRGVYVCDEWMHDFGAFRNWCIEHGYDENAEYMQCQLDRIDNNGPYAPWNCRFVTAKENNNNKRPPKLKCPELVTVYKVSLPRAYWQNIFGVHAYKIKEHSKKYGLSMSEYVLYAIAQKLKLIKHLNIKNMPNIDEFIDKLHDIAKQNGIDNMNIDELKVAIINAKKVEKRDKVDHAEA